MATTTSKYAYPDLPTTADRGMYDYYYDIDRVIRKIGTSTEDTDSALTAAKVRITNLENKVSDLDDKLTNLENKLEDVMQVIAFMMNNFGMRIQNLEFIQTSIPVVQEDGSVTNPWSLYSSWNDWSEINPDNYNLHTWEWNNEIDTKGFIWTVPGFNWDKLLEQARDW